MSFLSRISGRRSGQPRTPPGADLGRAGLLSGLRLQTAFGLRPVEGVIAGDQVMTFDHGLRTVTAVRRRRLPTRPGALPPEQWPLRVPVGAFANPSVDLLCPGQPVVIESDYAEAVTGDPFVAIPVAALEGMRGVTRVPPTAEMEVITLEFAQPEVVISDGNALFLCLGDRLGDLWDAALPTRRALPYVTLGLDAARALILRQVHEAHGWDSRLAQHNLIVRSALETARG
jgi:hypothetical protein